MSVLVSSWIVALAGAHLALGLFFALAFLTKGLARVDPIAARGPLAFKLLLVPGVAALWPLLLRCWVRGGPLAERSEHRARARSAEEGA